MPAHSLLKQPPCIAQPAMQQVWETFRQEPWIIKGEGFSKGVVRGTLIFGRSMKFLATWMDSLSKKAGLM